jgi:hypothetical protein
MGKTLQSLCAGNYWEGMAAEADRQLDAIRAKHKVLLASCRREDEARMQEIDELRKQGAVIEARLPSTEWFDSVDDVRSLCFDLRDRLDALEAGATQAAQFASTRAGFRDVSPLCARLDALESQVKTPSDDDGVSNRLDCLEHRVARLFEPTTVGQSKPAPATIAVPVETLKEWAMELRRISSDLSNPDNNNIAKFLQETGRLESDLWILSETIEGAAK